MTITAAALQLFAQPGKNEENIERLEEAVGSLPDRCELAVAPELYTSGYDLDLIADRGAEIADPADGETVGRLSRLAADADLTLVVGFLEIDGDALFDAVLVADPDGRRVVYRKTHLYPAEQPVLGAGDELVVAPTRRARVGVMICFEHAFPELATSLALDGTQILAIPSAVPKGYEYVLNLRTRARAQDNQLFVVATNMADPFCGESLVVDPRGDVLAAAGTEEEIILATLDLGAVEAERSREPALHLRRPELYR